MADFRPFYNSDFMDFDPFEEEDTPEDLVIFQKLFTDFTKAGDGEKIKKNPIAFVDSHGIQFEASVNAMMHEFRNSDELKEIIKIEKNKSKKTRIEEFLKNLPTALFGGKYTRRIKFFSSLSRALYRAVHSTASKIVVGIGTGGIAAVILGLISTVAIVTHLKSNENKEKNKQG